MVSTSRRPAALVLLSFQINILSLFVQQPTPHRQRLNICHASNISASDGQPAKRRGPKPDSKPALTRRQELNRQAQRSVSLLQLYCCCLSLSFRPTDRLSRTHRQRKEVYIKSLEDQVMTFKEHLAVEVRARTHVEEENERLRAILIRHGIQLPPNFSLPSPQHYGGYSSATSDGGMGSTSGDYATPSSYPASGSEYDGHQHGPASAVSAHTNGNLQPRQNLPLTDQAMQGNSEENQLGIDFVLASVNPPRRGETTSPPAVSNRSMRTAPTRLSP